METEPAEPPLSLAARVAEWLRAERAPARGDWRIGATVAALIALGPVLTIGGAKLLTEREQRAVAQLEQTLAPRVARQRAAEQARAMLAPALASPALGNTIETLAAALPPDAGLVRAARDAQGVLQLEITAPDPDRLRSTLRRAPALAGLRNIGQHQGDAAMTVSFRGVER